MNIRHLQFISLSYTSFSVGKWLRFFDVLAYRGNVQSILTQKKKKDSDTKLLLHT